MNYVNSNGEYVYIEGTKTLARSDHPAYQARIELALGQGEWLCAPSAGHGLARFERAKQTQNNVESFQKEVAHYLSAYSPDFVSALISRGALSIGLQIDEEALSG